MKSLYGERIFGIFRRKFVGMEDFIVLVGVLLVMGALFLIVDRWMKFWGKLKRREEQYTLIRDAQKHTFPMRLQAYERVLIFLERMDFKSMVIRFNRNGMNAKMLQAEMVKGIRDEFEHNLSQQLYVSDGAWNLIVFAKEECVRIIQHASIQAGEEASVMEFSGHLFETMRSLKSNPIKDAIQLVKKDLSNKIIV
ncbi:MAG: hypothetical protein ACI9YL_002122 [Luteibaculaceae bacterium]|jgi:hypothetical protein